MPFQLDRELEATLVAMAESVSQSQAPKRGDWKALREAANAGRAMMASRPPFPEIEKNRKQANDQGGFYRVRWYSIKIPIPVLPSYSYMAAE